jgi:hypothetical protein
MLKNVKGLIRIVGGSFGGPSSVMGRGAGEVANWELEGGPGY